MNSPTVNLVLSRRNLLTLLKKLDHVKDGGQSACTIVKPKSPGNRLQGCDQVFIKVVEDEDYYKDREPGKMFDNVTGKIY